MRNRTRRPLLPALAFLLALGARAQAPNPPAAPTPAAPTPAAPMPAAPTSVLPPGAPQDAALTPSGLASTVLRAGQGTERPGPDSLLTFHYKAWDQAGKLLGDTHVDAPPRMLTDRLMKGMREGLLLMTRGERRRLWIPEALAYAGMEGKPKGTITMELELIEIEPSPAQAPPDVAAPPADAKVLRSGLAYRVLRPGTGKDHPDAYSTVTVHYTGWTTDGKMFDSSVLRRQAATFPLQNVIAGWTEGVPLMVPGERTRFWIPEKLAYKGEKGRPAGMLVFDIELLTIDKK